MKFVIVKVHTKAGFLENFEVQAFSSSSWERAPCLLTNTWTLPPPSSSPTTPWIPPSISSCLFLMLSTFLSFDWRWQVIVFNHCFAFITTQFKRDGDMLICLGSYYWCTVGCCLTTDVRQMWKAYPSHHPNPKHPLVEVVVMEGYVLTPDLHLALYSIDKRLEMYPADLHWVEVSDCFSFDFFYLDLYSCLQYGGIKCEIVYSET